MRIDPTIYQAIDDGTLSCEQIFAMVLEIVLEHVAADAIAAGFAAADVKLEIEELRKNPSGRFETVRQMLESGATSLQ
jgi:hypothetical protein